jgi:hypothetical protein
MILGMSVAGLLDLQVNALDYLKAFNQLLYEYEYHSTHEPGSLSGKPKMVPLGPPRVFPICKGRIVDG